MDKKKKGNKSTSESVVPVEQLKHYNFDAEIELFYEKYNQNLITTTIETLQNPLKRSNYLKLLKHKNDFDFIQVIRNQKDDKSIKTLLKRNLSMYLLKENSSKEKFIKNTQQLSFGSLTNSKKNTVLLWCEKLSKSINDPNKNSTFIENDNPIPETIGQKVILAKELGLVEYIDQKYDLKGVESKIGEILGSVIGEKGDSVRSALNAIKTPENKNNPYTKRNKEWLKKTLTKLKID